LGARAVARSNLLRGGQRTGALSPCPAKVAFPVRPCAAIQIGVRKVGLACLLAAAASVHFVVSCKCIGETQAFLRLFIALCCNKQALPHPDLKSECSRTLGRSAVLNSLPGLRLHVRQVCRTTAVPCRVPCGASCCLRHPLRGPLRGQASGFLMSPSTAYWPPPTALPQLPRCGSRGPLEGRLFESPLPAP
jgi:hypothetical protein